MFGPVLQTRLRVNVLERNKYPGGRRDAMNSVPRWFERKFDFTLPVEQYPNLHVRLWGSPARLEEMLRFASRDVLLERPGGKWSAQEHAGHLADLEHFGWPVPTIF